MDNLIPFKILTSPDNTFKAIVVSLVAESLTDSLGAIKSELLSARINGKILFDYFLSTGQNNRRFFEMEFNGDFLLNTFHKTTINEQIKKSLADFYSQNHQYIASSMLSKPLKYYFNRNNVNLEGRR
jgi:hypothetical protein